MFEQDFDQDTEINIPELVEKLKNASDEYYNENQSSISDEEFDRLKDLLKQIDPKNKFLYQIGSSVKVSEWKKAKHKIPMGSLNKVNSVIEFVNWTKQCGAKEFNLTVKLDGISIALEYKNGKLIDAITRGDGEIGESILPNVIQMKNVKKTIPDFSGILRGEIVIHRDDFISLNKEAEKNGDRIYKNPRNAASGIAKNYEGKYCNFCSVLFYDILSNETYDTELQKFGHMVDLDLKCCYTNECQTIEECLNEYEQFEIKLREEYPYELDGLVIVVDDIKKAKALGEAYGNRKAAIAWKFGAIKKETEIIGVEWQVGNNRRITPVAKFKPTQVGGITIENASLANVDLFLKLKLGMNDKVIISRRNDVIPYLEEVVKHVGEKFQHPEYCPICILPTEIDSKYLICSNDNCPALYCGNLFKWIDKLEIMDVSYSFIEKLFQNDMVKTPYEFYALTVDNIMVIDGLGERSATKFLDQLHSKMEIELPTFIGGLNMASFSTSICEKLMNAGYDTIEKLMFLDVETLCKIPGIKEKIARKIVDGLYSKKNVIKDLLAVGIKIKSNVGKEINQVSNHLNGSSFVFTGAIEKVNPESGKNYKREELQKMVMERGGINHSSLTKGTTFLVQADPSSESSKTKKALQYGTKILSEKNFFKMLEGK